MAQSRNVPKKFATRRSFLKQGVLAAGAATVGAGLMGTGQSAHGQHGGLTPGDVAILRLLAAAETIESDLWQQYAELGGLKSDPEVQGQTGPKAGPNALYVGALQQLDTDMPTYIHDNTDDEISHEKFLNAYLMSKGAQPVNLDKFRRIPGSTAQGARLDQQGNPLKRITNLTQLTVDTTWWTRYRSDTMNPDLGGMFDNAVPDLAQHQHTAIPRTDADTSDSNFLQVIANTAGFHFGFIEQGGTSLYATLAQKVHSPEVLRILLSIGGSEIMHFQVWHDKAGNAPAFLTPVTDPVTGVQVTFPNLGASTDPLLQANLIMPEPCPFIPGLPACAIIRPTGPGQIDALGAINSFIKDGLFIGQPDDELTEMLLMMAAEADEAHR